MEKEKALETLSHFVAKREDAEGAITTMVRAARRAGATWQAVGEVLGVTKQRAQQKYADSAAEPNRYTCNCGWSHIIPEDAEGITRETAVVLAHIQDAHPEIGEKIRADREVLDAAEKSNPIPTHAPNGQPIYLPSIGDTPETRAAELAADDNQEPVTPSIFSDAAAPAKQKKASALDRLDATYEDERPGFWLASAGQLNGVAQPGTGKGPHTCPRCGSTNHKGSIDEVRAYFDCTPTKYDPQDITDYLKRTGLK